MTTHSRRVTPARRSRWIAAALAAAGCAGFDAAAAQAPAGGSAPDERERLERELVELFGKVERNLRAIDGELGSAAAGETPLGVPAESGIGALLQSARARGREVDQQVTRIIELAGQLDQGRSNQGQSGGRPQSSRGESKGEPGGESPLDQARNEPRPSEPTPKEGAPEHPDPGQSGDPRGNQQVDSEGKNRPTDRKPAESATGARSGAAGGAAWGELPERAREVFRTQGGADMPVEYRDWIDAYYRRLNRTRRP